MVRFFCALAIALMPLAATAEDAPLSAEAFETYVEGKTLSFSNRFGPFGAEDYLEGRRVRWSYLDGECLEGRWYPEGSHICFVYDDIPTPQCWSFYLTGGALMARFENRPGGTELYETAELDEPLMCLGPRIGA